MLTNVTCELPWRRVISRVAIALLPQVGMFIVLEARAHGSLFFDRFHAIVNYYFGAVLLVTPVAFFVAAGVFVHRFFSKQVFSKRSTTAIGIVAVAYGAFMILLIIAFAQFCEAWSGCRN